MFHLYSCVQEPIETDVKNTHKKTDIFIYFIIYYVLNAKIVNNIYIFAIII
jgi:hypothetical protein